MSDNLVQTQLMMAQSFGELTSSLLATKTMQTSTRDVVATLEVPAGVTAISVGGVTTEGDGSAGLYVRVAADPGTAQKVQSADGSWFQLAIPTSVMGSTIVSSGSSITAATTVSAGSVISSDTTISAGTLITAAASINAGTTVNAGTALQVAGTKVIGTTISGWGTPTGTATRATFTSTNVTLTALAARVAQLIEDLKTHGLIST